METAVMRCFNPLTQIESGDSTPSTGKTVEDGVTLPLNNSVMKISKSMRKQLLERAMHKTGIQITNLIPADCKLQDFWALIEGCEKSTLQEARALYRALLGEYFVLYGFSEAVEREVWEDLYEAQNQDARCILAKYGILNEEDADVLRGEGFIPSPSYVPRTRYGKHVEECILNLTPVRMRG